MATEVMRRGTVEWFNDSKGFGFILSDASAKSVFVHYSAIETDGFKTLAEGQEVIFELVDGPRGPQAIHVLKGKVPVRCTCHPEGNAHE